MRPLDGCQVIDLSLLLPGPLATQILRDLGAEVTKVEPPGAGDYGAMWPPMVGPVSASYAAINRGKSIMRMDLKNAIDRQRFLDLAAAADVVVEGFRPGVVDRLGVGYETLRQRNPRIVLCSITGYGQTGPYAARAGHDLNYQAMAGVLSLAGGDAPSNPAVQIADTAAGSYAAAMLIMAALLERERTGVGRHIDVSMSEQLLPLLTAAYATAGALGRDPARDAELLTGGAPCYRVYRTADARWVAVGALEPKFWSELLAALGLEHLADAAAHGGVDAPSIVKEIAAAFARRPLAHWIETFSKVDACVEAALEFHESLEHPQWQARDSFEALATPDGRTLRVPRMPGSLAGFGREASA